MMRGHLGANEGTTILDMPSYVCDLARSTLPVGAEAGLEWLLITDGRVDAIRDQRTERKGIFI